MSQQQVPADASYIVSQVLSPCQVELYSAFHQDSKKFVVSLHGVAVPKNGQAAMKQCLSTLLPSKKTVHVAFSGSVDESGAFVAEIQAEMIEGMMHINKRMCEQPKSYQDMPPRPIPKPVVVVPPPAPKPVLAPKPPAPKPAPAPVPAPAPSPAPAVAPKPSPSPAPAPVVVPVVQPKPVEVVAPSKPVPMVVDEKKL